MVNTQPQAISDDFRIDYTDKVNSIMDNPQWSSVCVLCLKEAVKNDDDPIYAICYCQTNQPRVAHESCIEFQEDIRIKKPGDIIFNCLYCNIKSAFVRKITSKQPTETIEITTRTFWTFFNIITYAFVYFNYCKNIGRILIAFNEELSYGHPENILTNQINLNLQRYDHYIVNSAVASLYKFCLGLLTTNYHTDTISIEFIQISIVLLGGYLSFKFSLNFLIFFLIEIYCFILSNILLRKTKTKTITINLRIINLDLTSRNIITIFAFSFSKTILSIILKNFLMEIHFTKIQWFGIGCLFIQLNCIFIMYFEERLVSILRKINISPTVQ